MQVGTIGVKFCPRDNSSGIGIGNRILLLNTVTGYCYRISLLDTFTGYCYRILTVAFQVPRWQGDRREDQQARGQGQMRAAPLLRCGRRLRMRQPDALRWPHRGCGRRVRRQNSYLGWSGTLKFHPTQPQFASFE